MRRYAPDRPRAVQPGRRRRGRQPRIGPSPWRDRRLHRIRDNPAPAAPRALPRERCRPPRARRRWPWPVLVCGPMDRADPQVVSRARGALLGLVAGNQLGVPTEHLGTPEAIRKAFPNGVSDLAPPPKNSPYDDDAAMALLLGESLVQSNGFDAADVARRWVKWMKVDGRGIGITTKRALTLTDRGKEPFQPA